MRSMTLLRELDERTWSTAAWTTPIMIQLVLGAVTIALVLTDTVPPYVTNSSYSGGPVWFLIVAAVPALISVPVGSLLLTSRSSRVRGLALSFAGSAAIILVGAIMYASWVVRW